MLGQRKSRVVDLVDRNLSSQEIQILQLMADGFVPDEIGKFVGVSSFAVKAYTESFVTKLNANSVAHALAIAIRQKHIQ